MPKKYKNLSPFGEWLVKLVEDRETTITTLAREAGLFLAPMNHKCTDGVSWTFIRLPTNGWSSTSHLCETRRKTHATKTHHPHHYRHSCWRP
jgi:hypothetical protein